MDTVYLEPANSGYSHQVLRLAVAAYLARYKGESRTHTGSDLRSYLRGASGLTACLTTAQPRTDEVGETLLQFRRLSGAGHDPKIR